MCTNNMKDTTMPIITNTYKTYLINNMSCRREPAHAPYERREFMWDPVEE